MPPVDLPPIELKELKNPPLAISVSVSETILDIDEKTHYLTVPIKFDNLAMSESKLNSFKLLATNWDGYGASSIDEITIINSKKFLGALPEHVVDNVDLDDITPTPYGTIVIDWRNSLGEMVSTEIGKNTFGFFSEFSDNESPKVDSVNFNENSIPRELFAAFHKLFQA